MKFHLFAAGYIKAAAALCVVCLLTDMFATLMTGLGLRSTDHQKKYTYYRVAVYIMILSREHSFFIYFRAANRHVLPSDLAAAGARHLPRLLCLRTQRR
jgi:hypothetical protein